MGSGEERTPAKLSKPATGTQEVPTTPSYPDWTTPMQAYYGAGATPPPAFFASTVASSPTPHPYLWGSQHLIPPYGTPLPYPAIYPHGGIYAHTSMVPSQGTVAAATETEAKSLVGKDRGSMKSKGSLGNINLASGKSGEGGKAATSANDVVSQSGESGTEGSSDASDDSNQDEFPTTKKRSFHQMLADGTCIGANAQRNHVAPYSVPAVESSFNAQGQQATNLLVPLPEKPAGTVPATNLNIGMDLWNSSPAGTASMKVRHTASGATLAIIPSGMVVREGVPSDLWIHDERELKRQRRKQSNRESARRSRLRKQAECEELASKVETLTNENRALRSELQRVADECEKLTSENASIMEQLNELYRHDGLTTAKGNDTKSTEVRAVNDEDNRYVHEKSRGSNSASDQQNGKYFNSNGKLESGRN